MAHTNEKAHMTSVKTHKCLYEQDSLEPREMHFKLSLMHFISIIHPTSLKHGEFEIISLFKKKKKKNTLFTNSETQMAFVAKNIFIIKACYNKKFPDSVIDYKR